MTSFTLSSAELSRKIGNVIRVIEKQNSVSSLEEVVFSVSQNRLTLTGSSADNTLSAHLSDIQSDGTVSFSVKKDDIADAIKELGEQPITFKVDMEAMRLTATYQNGQFSVPVHDTENYPFCRQIGEEETQHDFSLTAKLLSRLIDATINATADDELRVVMNGILFEITPEGLNTVASDGHQLVLLSYQTITSEETASFILPKKPAKLLGAILGNDETTVEVKFTENTARIIFGDYVLGCRLIEGRYPAYGRVMPDISKMQAATLDRVSLLSTLKRVETFSNSVSLLVKMDFALASLMISTEDTDFGKSAQESLTCDYGGSPMVIGFRSSIIKEMLTHLPSEEVCIHITDPARAAVVTPAVQDENLTVKMLIMPQLIR